MGVMAGNLHSLELTDIEQAVAVKPAYRRDVCPSRGLVLALLKPFQIFDYCPAFGFTEISTVLVATITVAIRISRVSHEDTVLEGRLIGYIADVPWVKRTATNHEGRLPPFGRR
jgi:hypothetical protein